MSRFDELRAGLLKPAAPAAVEPEPEDFGPVALYHEKTRDYVEVAPELERGYRARGYARLAPGQTREQLAREALDLAAVVVAERINRPVIDRERLGHAATVPNPVTAGDLLTVAYLAECICQIAAELDEVKREVRTGRTQEGEK